ncbi:hypothetical protein K4K59_005606 [Colletotrichum sp. SAR11_240]|nr:hypothetical protein K4K59_005606 [Colletotrichum sp. SAR11_240]
MGQRETQPRAGLRQRSRTALLIVACALALYAGVVQILTLIAGTWVTRGCDGVQRLGLSSLSILKFDGIVPSPSKPGSYDLTMHLFLSSFGYEYPNASASAFATAEPNLPYDFIQIGEHLGVDPSSWACLRSADQCTSPFFNTFSRDSFQMTRTLEYASHILALSCIALLFLTEALIAVRPSWLRCQCYFAALKRVCPCPRGSRAQIEALSPGFWDRYRAWVWTTLPAFVFLPAFGLAMKGLLLKSYVSRPGAAPIAAGAVLLGGGLYAFNRHVKPENPAGDPAQQVFNTNKPRPTADEVANKKQQADAKRDLGMGGAGVGMNQMTGGTDIGSGLKSGNTDNPNRDTPKGPKDKFPSDAGAIGGGQGRGNANSRAIETHGPGSSAGASNTEGGISQKLGSMFGTGGGSQGKERHQRPVDTKVASHMADTPTNRGGSPWDKHRKDVTAAAASNQS